MIRYNVCNLEHSNNFSIENITFTKVTDYDKRKSHLYDDDTSDQWTFNAEAPDKKLIEGSKLNPGGNNNCVNDIMILLSIAQSRNIYFWKAEDISDTNTKPWGMLGGNRKAGGGQVIMEHEIENYLNISLTQIRKTDWLEKTGFNPAVFWWLESIYKDRRLEITYPSAFTALEVLANSYCNEKKLSPILPKDEFNKKVKPSICLALSQATQIEPYKTELMKEKILELNNPTVRNKIKMLKGDCEYDWDFMDDNMIQDWVKIRNKFMHEGSTKTLERQHEISKVERDKRYLQLVYSVQILLIDLLGFKKFHQRDYWINTIQNPPNTQYKPIGPHPLVSRCEDKEHSS